jgi:hypothetical protein
MTSKYFKPDPLGPSTQQMKKEGKITTKVKERKSDSNGKVMTGEAFKWLKG